MPQSKNEHDDLINESIALVVALVSGACVIGTLFSHFVYGVEWNLLTVATLFSCFLIFILSTFHYLSDKIFLKPQHITVTDKNGKKVTVDILNSRNIISGQIGKVSLRFYKANGEQDWIEGNGYKKSYVKKVGEQFYIV